MEEQHPRSTLESLEARTGRLERWLKLTTCGWLMTVGAVGLTALIRRLQAETPQAKEPGDILRVRQLIVVDDKGAERVVVGAPLPDPQVRGERRSRRSPATGVQIKGPDGNERGGVAMLEDGTMVLGIDDENGEERAHLFYIPGRGAGLAIRDDEGKERISLPGEAQE
jgi:hypothetical protein